MYPIPKNTNQQRPDNSKKSAAASTEEALYHLAFDNSLQPNIITIPAGDEKIITANPAACKLLGYSKKELLTKTRADIFDINESSFKKMYKQRTAEGQVTGLITAIKKNGSRFPCEVTSAVFMDEQGIKTGITTLADMSQIILKQKNADAEKEKIVAFNIVLAKSKQIVIDIKKEKIVTDNIDLAISRQTEIDIKREKIVTDNIDLAISRQTEIDIKKEKIVADNIILAQSKQKEIDVKKEKIVTDNIDLAISRQTEIDIKREKIVADNIILAQSKQKEIDVKKEKIVTDNIDLAISRQTEIDIKKEKIVADNIILAKTRQKEIDVKKEKVVAADIVLAKSTQKNIDIEKEKIVAGDIIRAQAKADSLLAENNKWIKYIAKTSYDLMWDWDIASGKIYVSDSIEELFGYKAQNHTVNFSDFRRCLLPGKRNSIEDKLLKTLASRKNSWNDSYMFKRADGSVASTTSRASIIRDAAGKAIRLIGAIQDVSRLHELEKKLEEQISIQEEHKFLLSAKLSFDVIWDWDLLTNEVFIGEGFEELFGYSIKNNKGYIADKSNYIHPDDKETVEKGLHEAIGSSAVHWEHSYRFTRSDGSLAKVFDRASILRHADGKAYRMIGAMQDLSRQKELEEMLDHEMVAKEELLTEYKERFKLISNFPPGMLYEGELIPNDLIITDAFEKEFIFKTNSNMRLEENWISHIHPDDKDAVLKDYFRMLTSDDPEHKYKVLEEKLEQEIKLKEKQIAEAMVDAKDTERSDIGKELHDNINQLLGVSRLYLQMAKGGGENSEMYLNRSSEYTLTAIEEIRKLTKGLTTDIIKNLGLCEAIENVVRDTMEVNPIKISCALQSFIENSVSRKFKLNVYRILQEQLNNILKHAGATYVIITLLQNKKSIVLTISDNGVGFDTGKKRKGIGVDNIINRAVSYNGTADFVSQPGQGCVLTVTFPATDALLNVS
jgi:PAS domain S-box-containing protein